ncbi:hypothetical protein BGZ76_000705 [Entomortierella beljakovae]|nr:hypothetical protein BGZ76_000705 [Entomortierella beljakovae]
MKVLLSLTLASCLVASVFAGPGTKPAADVGVKAFLADPQINALAPHLVGHVTSRISKEHAPSKDDVTPSILEIPLLHDIVEIVSQTVFNPLNTRTVDWSRLEEAKLEAIRNHGEDAVINSSNLSAIDAHRASLIVNTIYDTVIHIPSSSKETYKQDTTNDKSSFWDVIGFGLLKSSNAVSAVKSAVTQQAGCDTADVNYLKGVDEVVYYSSLTDGLAGSTMAAEANDPTIKSLEMGTIIGSVSKLAVEIHMGQSIARLADLDPADEHVRAMIYLALAADSTSADFAQSARDLYTILTRNMISKIPETALKSLQQQATLYLITKGAGHAIGKNSFPDLPIIRNIFSFSSEVLSANNVGNVLKYVFCPGGIGELNSKGEKVPAAGESTPQANDGAVVAESADDPVNAQEAEHVADDDDEDDEDDEDDDGIDDDEDEDHDEENLAAPAAPESAPKSGDQTAFKVPEEAKGDVKKEEL